MGIQDYVCCAGRSGPGREEHSDENHIVLMRHGAFCKHFGRRHSAADVNQAAYFSKGSSYRVSHPGDCGDRGTVFVVKPRVLNDIVRELDPSVDTHPQQPFPFLTGPCDSAAFWRHRELVLRLEAASVEPLEPLWADVVSLQLVADVLEAAFVRDGRIRKRRYRGTERAHADQAEAAKSFLAGRLGEHVTLSDVAAALHASPFHLARVFHERAGIPVHRYLTRLRLRASLERIADGARDLTAVALDLGFSSHSHFTDAFRKEFRCKPSDVRRQFSRQAIRELSKNLKV